MALDYGEAQSIFAPSKTKAKGLKPYPAKKSRITALGFVDLLRANGYQAGAAIAKVAAAYGVSRASIKQWQKELKKINDPFLQLIRKKVATSQVNDVSDLIGRLQEAAKEYQAANKKKKDAE